MADKIKNNFKQRESLPSETGQSAGKEFSKKEILEQSRQFVEGVGEVVEGVEVAETTGEIAENLGESKKKVAGGGFTVNQQQQVVGATQTLPSIEIMRIQVSTQIKKEIRMLEKEANRLMRSPGGFHPFKLNTIVAKIRTLRDILASLADVTADALKGLWLKFVKGITQ